MAKPKSVQVQHNYNSMISKYRCRQCGEEFIVRCAKEDYAYKRGMDVFCKWSCMRAYDGGHPPKVRNVGQRAVTI